MAQGRTPRLITYTQDGESGASLRAAGFVPVTSGEFEVENLVATPVEALRASMRLYESGLGLAGFVLGLLDFYTGARWGELVGQQRHEYDSEARAIQIREPLKEVGGHLFKGGRRIDITGHAEHGPRQTRPVTPRRRGGKAKKGRTKTPAGTRSVELPPSIAVFYEELLDSHGFPFVLCSAEGAPLRRSNFRNRYWRPVWDGSEAEGSRSAVVVPPILPTLTFHEGRHSHNTWLAEDGIPEVARRARLGQKMKGIAKVYDHVTPLMRRQILQALETRWIGSLVALTSSERTKLGVVPSPADNVPRRAVEEAPRAIECRLFTTEAPPLRGGTALLTCENAWCAILGLNQ